TWVPEFAALGAVTPLDTRINASVSDDYFAGILDANRIDGATFGAPWYVDTRVLFYRTDVLAEAGFNTPPSDWNTWLAALTAVKQRVGTANYAILLPTSEWQPPVILAMQRGAALLRDGDRYGDFQSSAFREAFAFYLDLFRRGLAPTSAAAQI